MRRCSNQFSLLFPLFILLHVLCVTNPNGHCQTYKPCETMFLSHWPFTLVRRNKCPVDIAIMSKKGPDPENRPSLSRQSSFGLNALCFLCLAAYLAHVLHAQCVSHCHCGALWLIWDFVSLHGTSEKFIRHSSQLFVEMS